ncbi:hypothetical protein H9C73_00475 [Marinobacterium sp. AK62]|uniref:Glycosyltransferase n=1 Tax=Marinobacterium alkalitolerans TaxID=1542925 RepID=A0ABS3Z664_9GAMM|nr:hypothetical protein [Marinobacterium alkalitolerans]MBP0047194.1 hypothetical protein [Marinobacterium alkalitolerans]
MSEAVHFVCLKWGDKYPASYVNRLYHMVSRNLTQPFRFHCLTENASGLEPGIEHLPLETSDLTGWWYKLSLFQRDFFGLEGDLVYLDLDVVITGNIDFLINQPGDFIIIRNWSRNKMWNSSVMRFRIGEYAHVWERFQGEQERVVRDMNGDQEWIYACVPEAKNWPADKIVSYKKSLKSKAFRPLEKLGLDRLGLKAPDWMDTPLPAHAAIVIFHGKPDPEDVATQAYGLWKRASFIERCWK